MALTWQADVLESIPSWWEDIENSLDNAFTRFNASLIFLEKLLAEKFIRQSTLTAGAFHFEQAAGYLNRVIRLAWMRLSDAEAAGQPQFSPVRCSAMAAEAALHTREMMVKLSDALEKTDSEIKKHRPAVQKINQVYGSISPFYIDLRL